ncbi:MAG: hypothetical protein JWN44_2386 [Myxococcales bacterium]|nr:hypothetical protein [Myxococcales bacterium]
MKGRAGDGEDSPASSTITATAPAGAVMSPSSSPATLERGAELGRYIVLGRLGGGGMGVVYSAYDPELDRKLAVKLLRPEVMADQSRLRREAQAMARLQHPNVIAVYDVGLFYDRVFVAMELVDGTTLARWLEEGQRSWAEVVEVFRQAGGGLAAAHAVGLVHRDFKLANVLIGHDGRVRVVDFGLARSLGSSSELTDLPGLTSPASQSLTLNETMTRTGALLGTPTYISPEQFRGEPADARSDQFSFSVALYRALYGERPFGGGDLSEIAAEVGSGRLRAPPKDSRVPTWLRDVVLRGLATEADRRWPSMDALLAALARDPAKVRRRRMLVGAALAGLLALVLGYRGLERRNAFVCRGAERKLIGVWDEQRRAAVHASFVAIGKPYAEDAFRGVARALDAYARSWTAMHTDACEATRLRGEQSEELLDLRMECLSQRRDEMHAAAELFAHADEQVVEKALQVASGLGSLELCANTAALKVPDRRPADPATRAKLGDLRRRVAGFQALEAAGKYREALPGARAAVDEARSLGYRPVEAEALFWLGRLDWRDARDQEAEEKFVESAAAAVAGRDDFLAARGWTELALNVGRDPSRVAEAHRWELIAEAAIARAGNDELRGDLCRARGNILTGQEKPDQALIQDRQALALFEHALGHEHPKVARALTAIGADLIEQGRSDEALVSYRRALALAERSLGFHHPDLALPLIDLGLILGDRGRFEESLADMRRALTIREQAFGPDHPDVAFALGRLAEPLERAARYDEAIASGRHALKIYEKALGPQSEEVAFTLNRIGEILLDQGRFNEALVQYRRALTIYQKVLEPDDTKLAYAWTGVGRALLGMHDASGALGPLERALMLRERQPGEPMLIAETRFALGRALLEHGGDRERARRLAREARVGYAAAGPGWKKELTAVDSWLSSQQ